MAYADINPVVVNVYRNRSLDKDSIIRMSGAQEDSTLTELEIKRRLETSGLFWFVYVEKRIEKDLTVFDISIEEKGTWFVVPYYSTGFGSTVFGLAGGKASFFGQHAYLLARLQAGPHNRVASFLIKDEYVFNSPYSIGVSFDYEDSLHREYTKRELTQSFRNRTTGGSLQLGYHIAPNLNMGLNTYLERHIFEVPEGLEFAGFQATHRLLLDLGTLTLDEGLTRGIVARFYFEGSNPALSDFDFRKYGISIRSSPYLNGDINWIFRPRFEAASQLPHYQLFEVGGDQLRSFAAQQFRAQNYFAVQNDLLLSSLNISKIKVRPLIYTDWAFVNDSGRTGIGAGLQLFLKSVVVPAIRVYAGYGFNPDGFAASLSIGPKI